MSNDLEINGYKIFENHDESIYAAKSREDVYDYFVNMYGSTEECQNETKEQFIENLSEIEVSSECSLMKRTYISDDTGEESISSYYEEYKKIALKNEGVDVVAYLVW